MTEQDGGGRINPDDLLISPEIRERFNVLRETWCSQTRLSSSLHADAARPAFREIVAMGQTTIPLILEDLRQDPSWLLMALFEITGENPLEVPVPEVSDGFMKLDFTAMKDGWLRWGEREGYIKPLEQKSDGK